MSATKFCLKFFLFALTFVKLQSVYLPIEYAKNIEIEKIIDEQVLEDETEEEMLPIGVAPPTGVNCSVYWTIVDPPFTFGSNIQLECRIHCRPNGLIEQKIGWIVNETKSIGLSSSKYIIWEHEKKDYSSRLEVRDFSPEDANINYMCSYEFHSYSQNLTLNKRNFERQPSKEDIFSGSETEGTVYKITVNIFNVFPRPNCTCVALQNLQNQISEIRHNYTENGPLYNAVIQVQYNGSGYFAVKCQIGRMTHRVFEENFSERYEGIQTEIKPKISSWEYAVYGGSVIMVMLIVAVVTTACFVNGKRQNKKQTKTKEDETEMPLMDSALK